uniref:F-box family protein n=1 Tax=Rhizophora mucronata TaxID=61149 RepID=A0A2P2JX92_RHIMU
MQLSLLVICFFFLLFLKFLLPLRPLPPWASDVRFLSVWFWKELLFLFSDRSLVNSTLFKGLSINSITSRISLNKMALISSVNVENTVDENGGISVLDLPELALECILERLPPAGLCSMAGVCTSLRQKCMSDHLWKRHMKQKWGRIIGPAAYREWQWYLASGKDLTNCKYGKHHGIMKLLSMFSPFSWIRSKVDCNGRQSSPMLVDSVMSWYLALETGRFWFPAQVYNRENGHVGFMLSCYDADLSYDPCTDTFQARYPPHGRRAIAIENNVPWERLRAPPVYTSPHDLHISDCLNDLCPGDHIEIQWRRNKEFPYGLYFTQIIFY